MTRKAFSSDRTPPPAGTYSVAIQAQGLVFLSGQTPRDIHNVRHGDKPFAEQARMALDNLQAAAEAAGLSLHDAVKVNVFLRNPADAKEFDAIYAGYVSDPPPARTLTQSNFAGFDIEVDTVLLARQA
ncbi:Enamine/imine deaminase [Achromobacter denitrificans]|uniref:RidA family protein n=1 Tax=Achromobacter denitrificans TaxID=32002 RepID=UPI00078754B0|nr:RidA family protein [Achromobacter denitrificans]OLU08128.1 enamine deaminase RidA [Achromobacter denitrificans]QKH42630.1 RidA family protein [Achromobacter denitrificans]QKH50227.1 RidA family protein [Achromobacter denitrificans]CAB3677540.1 2-iminobutanoate/2-iminopropanoate deaminase [Achromobacter denitrificans]SUU19333.1 Enamine/imine deaminase [Achromobacter denitrificans]